MQSVSLWNTLVKDQERIAEDVRRAKVILGEYKAGKREAPLIEDADWKVLDALARVIAIKAEQAYG